MFNKVKAWFKNTFSIKVNVGRRAFLGGLIAIPVISVIPAIPAAPAYDPVILPMLRRMMPNIIAYDLVGVQPMTGPTGMIFAMRSRFSEPGVSYVETGVTYPEKGWGWNPTPLQIRIERAAKYQMTA